MPTTPLLALSLPVTWGLALSLIHVLGLIAAAQALMEARTPQGAVAWIVLLVLVPYVTLPLWWVFGRSKFHGYVGARREVDEQLSHLAETVAKQAPSVVARLPDPRGAVRALETLADMPFTRGNDARLLIDGNETFARIFGAIESAERYVLVQYYVVRDDALGRRLLDLLAARTAAGVHVCMLYDEIGSHNLPRRYLDRMREAGIEVHRFGSTRGRANRFQVNFRNHRKIVVVDGEVGFVGGHNVGVEYLGKDPRYGSWRDTSVEIRGPAVKAIQLAFCEDWWWAVRSLPPDLDWTLPPVPDRGGEVLVLPSGPADPYETCALMYVQLIHAATRRLWIASPYFVPEREVIGALQLAALRGVDVRVMLPKNPDHRLVYLSAFSFLEEIDKAGVHVFRYKEGFMHHKVLVADDHAVVGTANLDNRSFRLNFEISLLFADEAFVAKVAAMLERDFTQCEAAVPEDLERRSFPFKLAVRVARLTAPIL